MSGEKRHGPVRAFGDGVHRDVFGFGFGLVVVVGSSVAAPLLIINPGKDHTLWTRLVFALILTVVIWGTVVALITPRIVCTDNALIIVGPWYRSTIPWRSIVRTRASGSIRITLTSGEALMPVMFRGSVIRAIFGNGGLRRIKATIDHWQELASSRPDHDDACLVGGTQARFMIRTFAAILLPLIIEAFITWQLRT